MKTQILVSLMAILAVIALVTNVSAVDLQVNLEQLSVKGVDFVNINYQTVSLEAGEVVPVKVVFYAWEDASDVKVKVSLSTHREDITAKTERFAIISGRSYSKLLSLKLPEDFDPSEDLVLSIEIQGKVGGVTKIFEENFDVTVQRASYNVEILDIDADKTVNAGENLAVDVVLKNRGFERLDDVFVIASIPELGVQKKVYFEDLTATDTCDKDEDCNKDDSGERKISLRIPSNTKASVYELKVEAYNSDSKDTKTMKIAVVGAEQESRVIVPISSKEITTGATETYDLVIVNSGNIIGTYEIIPETSDGVVVTVSELIVTVPGDSSKTVKVQVKALKEGTFTFAVNVNSEDKLVKRVVLNAVATGKAAGVITSNITILTIVLAIVFVVLLIVLIVLLTRRPAKSEELEESYY